MPVPRPRSVMRKIREVLRLSLADGFSRRQVGAATGLPYTTVADYLGRVRISRVLATRFHAKWPPCFAGNGHPVSRVMATPS